MRSRSPRRSVAALSARAGVGPREQSKEESVKMPGVDPLVRVNNVHKHFTRGGERINVLQGVNLEIPRGDFLALMGPSGSGKTTLLNLLGGLDQPTQGSLEIAGVQINTLGGSALSRWRAQNIGFVFQLYNLLPV